MARRGAFIVLEGCDRSGKSTQCAKLIESLRTDGKRVELMKFPDRTTIIGQMISEYLSKESDLSDAAVHLLFAANRWELSPTIEKKLHTGTTLIVDRYAYSGVAYTSAKPGFSLEWCKQPDIGLPQPDAVIYLNLPTDIAEKRGAYGDERYEIREFQEKVAKSFKLLKDKHWTVVEADKSMEDLHREILHIVNTTIDAEKSPTLSGLWTKNGCS